MNSRDEMALRFTEPVNIVKARGMGRAAFSRFMFDYMVDPF